MAAVGTYRHVTENLDALAESIEAEWRRLDRKQGITEDEEEFMTRLKHAGNLIDAAAHLILTIPE